MKSDKDNVMVRHIRLLRLVVLFIIASYGFLALHPDLRLAIPALVGVTAVITIALSVAVFLGEPDSIMWSPRAVLLIAAALRLLFLFRPPELSDDIYRYLWDGLQTLSGDNPYSLAPVNVQPGDDTSFQLLKRVNHSYLVTIYPPAAQLVFAIGAAIGRAL